MMDFSLNIIGTENETSHTLPSPFWFKLDRDIDAPADALTLVYLNEQIPNIQLIEISGDVDFFGVVDTISRQKDKSGEKTTLYCRSIAAMLLDSQEAPGKTSNPDIKVISITHSCSGLLKGFLYDSYTPVSSLTVSAGSSMWNFLTMFCEQTMGASPRITKDRYISTKPYNTDTVHDLSDYIAIEDNVDFSEVITSVSIRGEEGNYPISVRNPFVTLALTRHRYITPGIGWQNFREQYGDRVMKKSMLRFKTKTVTLNGFRAIEIGESGLIDGEEKAVIGLEFRLDASGATTRVTLAEKEYL